jgi:hypothetical protein
MDSPAELVSRGNSSVAVVGRLALTAWIVVPINYFWRPEYDVNWARGLFFREQHAVPGLLYLLIYLIVVPTVVYYPTHRFLMWLTMRWDARH